MVPARIVDDRRCFLGESPRWDPEGSRLVWIDILAGAILDRSLDGPARTSTTIGGRVGGIVLRAGGRGYAVGQEMAVRTLDPTGALDATLVEQIPGDGMGMRTNEMAVDPSGRLVFGTMAANKEKGTGALWRLEHSGRLTLLRDGLTVPNGLGWSSDATFLYHVDSPARRVVRLAYGDDGCGPPEVVATIEAGTGVPDGLCVDAEGGFWVAVNGGGQCRHYDADGTETERIEVSASAVASCVLVDGSGGPRLYLSTGASGMSEEDLLSEPGAGCLFVADVDTRPAAPPYFPG